MLANRARDDYCDSTDRARDERQSAGGRSPTSRLLRCTPACSFFLARIYMGQVFCAYCTAIERSPGASFDEVGKVLSRGRLCCLLGARIELFLCRLIHTERTRNRSSISVRALSCRGHQFLNCLQAMPLSSLRTEFQCIGQRKQEACAPR
jgi:hypothetical protein